MGVLRVNLFHCQKLGNKVKEYEDAFRYKQIDNQVVLSIADGATESSFSGIWAKMLTRKFVREPFFDINTFDQELNDLYKRWEEIIGRYNLPWYAIEKAKAGAFATLLGCSIKIKDGIIGELQILAIGDSCIFQVHNDNLELSFPIHNPFDFNNSPILISSKAAHNGLTSKSIQRLSKNFIPGDVFYIMTDAMAHWFLMQCKLQNHPWKTLQSNFSKVNIDNKVFVSWMNNLRENKMIRNDDCTLIIVET